MWSSCPFLGRRSEHPRPRNAAEGDKRTAEPLISALLCSVSLSGTQPHSGNTFHPPPPTPTPHFVLFPLLIALYFSSLCPISVLSFWESDIRKLQDHSPQLVRPCSLWLVMAHFDGWQPEVGEACLTHTVQTLVQQALPDRRFMRVIEVYTS